VAPQPLVLAARQDACTPSCRMDLSRCMGIGGSAIIAQPTKAELGRWQVEDKFSPYAKELLAKVIAFVEVDGLSALALLMFITCYILQEEVVPAKRIAEAQLPADPIKRWEAIIPVIEDLKVKAKCEHACEHHLLQAKNRAL
jgi:hypothetical protein